MSELSRNNAFPDWLITAKVHPPMQRADLLPRDPLTRRLDRELNGSLTLLHAPAGYGKSTALVGWAQRVAGQADRRGVGLPGQG